MFEIIDGSIKLIGNTFGGLGNAVLTGLTYSLVDKALMAIAKKNFGEGPNQIFLNEKQTSMMYVGVKVLSVVSAISLDCLLAPQSILVSYTALKAFEIAALTFHVASSANLLYKYHYRVSNKESVFSKDPDSVLAFLGSIVLIGRPPIIALGGAAGLIVAIVRNKLAEDKEG